jgi:signal transduction histidine kinase
MNRPEGVSVERRVATVVAAVIVLSAIVATVIVFLLNDPKAEARRLEATVDDLETAFSSRVNPQPILSALVRSGGVGGAVVYDASGVAVARAGEASRDAAEVVCRSVTLAGGNGTLCIEPPKRNLEVMKQTLAVVAAATIVLAILGAAGTTVLIRRHLRTVRAALDRAAADPTFARRIEPLRGETAPIVVSINSLLAQIQLRELELLRRAHELEVANRDLESFAHTVSHDLRGPLGSILGFAEALRDSIGGELTADGKEYVRWIVESGRQMRSLIDGLLSLSRFSRAELRHAPIDLSAIARGIATSLAKSTPDRVVEFKIMENVVADGDEMLLRAVLENLISNAWKFTAKRAEATIEFGVQPDDGQHTYYVRDNGAGFDPTQASKMFRPFQRLHSSKEFEGTGIGLATVQRILQRHGGKAWAEGEPGHGATIYFTTGSSRS